MANSVNDRLKIVSFKKPKGPKDKVTRDARKNKASKGRNVDGRRSASTGHEFGDTGDERGRNKVGDGALTDKAKRSVNKKSVEEAQSRFESEDGPLVRSAAWVGRTAGVAVRQLTSTARRAAGAMGIAQARSTRPSSSRKSTRRRRPSTKKR